MPGPFDSWGQTDLEYQGEEANVAAQRAMAQLHSAHAYQAVTEADQAKAFAQALQQSSAVPAQSGTGDPTMDMGSTLMSIANKTLGAAPIQSAKLAGQAATLQMHASQMAQQKANTQRIQLETQKKNLEELSGFLATADTEEKWNAGLITYSALNPNEQIPPIFQTFNPQLRERLQNGTTAGLNRINQMLREQALQDRNQRATDFLDFRREREARIAENEQLRTALAQNRAKVAGNPGGGSSSNKPLSGPDSAMRRQAEDLISKTFPDFPATEVGNAAYSVGARAMKLLRGPEGLDREQALENALEMAVREGEIAPVSEAYKVLGLGVSKGVYDAAPEFSRSRDMTGPPKWNRKGPAGASGSFAPEVPAASNIPPKGVTPAAARAEAQAFIQKNPKARAAVLQRLQGWGVSTEGL